MFNLHTRFAFDISKKSRLGFDLAYFKSMTNRINYKDTYCLRDSNGKERCHGTTRIFRSYIMEATSLKLTYNQLLTPIYRMNLSLGYFYYFDSRMPFSFHMDPANGDDFSISITSLHEFRLNRNLFTGFEIGGWGLNYQYPYYHLGLSLNYQLRQLLVGLGISTTFSPSFPESRVREFPGYDSRASYHPEVEIQYFF